MPDTFGGFSIISHILKKDEWFKFYLFHDSRQLKVRKGQPIYFSIKF